MRKRWNSYLRAGFDSGSGTCGSKYQRRRSGQVQEPPANHFKTTHEGQLQLVTDFCMLDPLALGWIDIVREVFAGSDFVDGPRAEAIAGGCRGTDGAVERYIRTREYGRDDIALDVKQNIAYSGKERAGGTTWNDDGSLKERTERSYGAV